jgi:uncharacterized membrane protein
MFTFIILVFIMPFILAILVLRRSEKLAIKNRATTEKEEAHIDEEMVIHQALEKAGALPSHHHEEEEIHRENSKEITKYYDNLFYILGYIVIAIEIWFIYISLKK